MQRPEECTGVTGGMLGGGEDRSRLGAAQPLGEHVARVAAPAAGTVVWGTVGTGGPFAQGTGDGALPWEVP